MIEKDKYGKALGVWHIDTNGADLDLHPQMGDSRRLKRMLMNEENRKDKAELMEKIEKFLLEIISRDYPPKDEEESKRQAIFVEYNSMELFNEVLVEFGITSQEEMERSKREALQDIKKSIGGN